MSKTLHVRTVIMSDVHLGTPHAKAEEAARFLKHVRCERLILNGDIIDGWRLRRDGRWTVAHTRFVRRVLTLVQKRGTEVIYLRGNHDDFVGRLLPLRLGPIRLAEDLTLDTPSGRYLVLHGDVFDGVVKNMVFLAHLGDAGYALLLRLNRIYNLWRRLRGKEYFSLSKAIKARVKQATSFIGRFEEQVAALARSRGCAGVICGHIHTPADKRIGGVHYLNSGDWVETMSAIVEHLDGRFELLHYADFAPQPPADSDHDRDEPADPTAPVLAHALGSAP